MNRFIRWAVMLATASVLFICGNTLAGDLEPPASPSDTGSAMYTFNDLYNRLATGAEGAKRTGGFAGLAILPEPSGRTITEIMSIMPATDANAASPADVIAGKIFWSLKAGSWGVRTGSLSAAHYDPTADDSGSVGEDIPLAGNLDPPSGPPDAGSAMYTLNDLYNRLATGAAGTDPEGGFTDPAASPAGTGRTIDEIMALMPAVLGDPSTSASPAYVIQGKKFWGLKDGAWGVQTGTLPLTCYGLAADDPNVCSGHGTCSTFDVCGCDTSYYGDECGDWSCFTYHWADSDTCGGHGDCVAPDHCVCDENYFNDYSYNPHNRESSRGWCSGENYIGPPEYTDVCECVFYSDDSYWYANCDGIIAEAEPGWTSGAVDQPCSAWFCGTYGNNDPAVCGDGNGDCVADNTCECYDGYSGFYCEHYTCFDISFMNPNVCSGNGLCMGVDLCQCFGGYSGDECDVAP